MNLLRLAALIALALTGSPSAIATPAASSAQPASSAAPHPPHPASSGKPAAAHAAPSKPTANKTPPPKAAAPPAAKPTPSKSTPPKLPPPKPAPPPLKPAAPLPFLPQVSNVRLDVSSDYVLLTESVRLPVGDYRSGDLRLFMSFGPVAPIACDAQLSTDSVVGDDTRDDASTIELPAVEKVPRAPPSARVLLGKSQIAGTVVHIKEAAFRKAATHGDPVLTLRYVLPVPPADDDATHEVMARLGAPEGVPITLSRIEVHGRDGIRVADAAAYLCGPEASTDPLRIASLGPKEHPLQQRAISPRDVVRNASDNLCIFYQTAP